MPNLGNVLTHWQTWFPELPLPKLPAIFGLDVAGVVAKAGELVQWFAPGDRVYVNPGLTCGSCPSCRANDPLNCRNYTFKGYFGFGPDAQKLFDAYPYGGLGEYTTAPQQNLVRLPDNVTFEQAARFGYLGTAYAALRKANAGPQSTVLINGISGTLAWAPPDRAWPRRGADLRHRPQRQAARAGEAARAITHRGAAAGRAVHRRARARGDWRPRRGHPSIASGRARRRRP